MTQPSRRDFVKLTAATLAGAAFAPSLIRAAEGNDEYGGLPMGIQSYTLRSMNLDNALKSF